MALRLNVEDLCITVECCKIVKCSGTTIDLELVLLQ